MSPRRYETQNIKAAAKRQDIRPAAYEALVWRCPRCDRICNRLRVSEAHEDLEIEHKCKCNAVSTAFVMHGQLRVRRGGIGDRPSSGSSDLPESQSRAPIPRTC